MNKTRNDGFTLVELLAVIVILAVVILIAVTAVVPRMNNAKKKAFIDEALVYLKAGKEMLVSDNAHGCYLISDLGNYVKQNKDGYSGTIFISDSRVSLNLTNGKYYLKTDNNRNISETDLAESAPNDFLSTCTAPTNPTSYGITYVLNGGTVSGTNPSSYTSYSDDVHLINPTKSGYRFVGWSGGKNLFDEEAIWGAISGASHEGDYFKFDNHRAYTLYGQNGNYLPINGFSPNKRYTYSLNGKVDGENNRFIFYFDYESGATSNVYINSNSESFSNGTSASGLNVAHTHVSYYSTNYVYMRYVQLEEGTTPTEYEAYMNNNTNVTIPKGSSGNRVYIANWEAI